MAPLTPHFKGFHICNAAMPPSLADALRQHRGKALAESISVVSVQCISNSMFFFCCFFFCLHAWRLLPTTVILEIIWSCNLAFSNKPARILLHEKLDTSRVISIVACGPHVRWRGQDTEVTLASADAHHLLQSCFTITCLIYQLFGNQLTICVNHINGGVQQDSSSCAKLLFLLKWLRLHIIQNGLFFSCLLFQILCNFPCWAQLHCSFSLTLLETASSRFTALTFYLLTNNRERGEVVLSKRLGMAGTRGLQYVTDETNVMKPHHWW